MNEGRFDNITGKVIGIVILGIILFALYDNFLINDNDESGANTEISVEDSVLVALCTRHNAISYSELLR